MPVIVFADLAGFSALTQAHGDLGASELAGAFEASVRLRLGRSAKLVKMMGDGAMIVTDDVLDAFELARHLVDDAQHLPGRPAVRVGIHMGDAVERAGDYFGHAINVAARVAAESEPSQILVTEAVRDEMLRLGEGEQLCDVGEHTLRNVSGRIRLFCLVEANDTFFLDPVCRMRFPEDETVETRVHDGVEYRFCSLGCAEAFARDPGVYAL